MIALHSDSISLTVGALTLTVICRPRCTSDRPVNGSRSLRLPAAILTLRTPACRWQCVSRVGGARAP